MGERKNLFIKKKFMRIILLRWRLKGAECLKMVCSRAPLRLDMYVPSAIYTLYVHTLQYIFHLFIYSFDFCSCGKSKGRRGVDLMI